MLWILSLLFVWSIVVIQCVLAPVFALFLQADNTFPRLLSFWAVGDDDMIGSGEADATRTGWRYLDCILWQWRNPGWKAARWVGARREFTAVGNPATSDEPYTPGWYFLMFAGVWEFYLIAPTFPGMCLRIRLGYKLGNWVSSELTGQKPNPAPVVCVVNPFKRRG